MFGGGEGVGAAVVAEGAVALPGCLAGPAGDRDFGRGLLIGKEPGGGGVAGFAVGDGGGVGLVVAGGDRVGVGVGVGGWAADFFAVEVEGG